MRAVLLLTILATVLAGCVQQVEHASTTPSTTAAVTPFSPEFGVKYRVKVVDVIDGDTIDVILSDGSKERVRVLCVDTPEKKTETTS